MKKEVISLTTAILIIYSSKNLLQRITIIPLYTDASVLNLNVGCAALILNEITLKKRLPNYYSINSAEAQAILLALELIKVRQGKNFVICSDSAVTLEALKSSNYVNPLIKSIKNLLSELRYSHPFPNIKFLWIPAHSGIIGNEAVDLTAKEASREENYSDLPIYHKDLREHWSKLTLNFWKNSWINLVDQKYARHVTDSDNKNLYLNLNRNDQVRITRIKIGHTNISHIYLMLKENPPICNVCNKKITIDHLFIDCTKYINERRKNNITVGRMISLEEGLNIKKVLQFLKDTGLYNKI